MLEQAGEIRLPGGREQLAGCEEILARVIDERLVQVPAARVVALERRTRHERGEAAQAPADLTRRRAKKQQVIRRAQRALGREGALHLAGPPFVLERAQRQPERGVGARELAEHRLHEVHVGFRVVRVARLDRRGADRAATDPWRSNVLVGQTIFGDAREIPLDLESDHQLHLLLRQAP